MAHQGSNGGLDIRQLRRERLEHGHSLDPAGPPSAASRTRHLSHRRADGKRSTERQDNLYRFLDEQRNSAGQGATSQGPAEAEQPSQGRRRLLLEAINSLKRISLEEAATPKSASNATEAPPALPPPARPQPEITNELHKIRDNLRYLSLVCRLKTPIRGGDNDSAERCVGELARKIDVTRKLVAGMLHKCGGCASACHQQAKSSEQERQELESAGGEPSLWSCPFHAELRSRERRERRKPQPLPPPPPTQQRKRPKAGDTAICQIVDRAKAALIGDPIFLANCGKETKWGQMTLPTSGRQIVQNSADTIGRTNLHRFRTRKLRQSAAVEVKQFAGRLAEKWEEIEETRIDRAISAACRRLRRAIRGQSRRRGCA